MTRGTRKLTFIWLGAVLAPLLLIFAFTRTVGPLPRDADDFLGGTEVVLLVLGTPLAILWVTYFLRWAWKVTNPDRKEVKQ
jgi:hypothetical protein